MTISLLITHTSSANAAAAEVLDALLPLDAAAKAIPTSYEGVLLVDTDLDPFQASRAILISLPSRVNRVVPLMKVVRASIPEITESVLKIIRDFRPFRSFAVRASVRGASLDKRKLEMEVGAAVKSNFKVEVDLEKPDFLVIVEVVDDTAGVSVLSSSYPISTRGAFKTIFKWFK